MNRAQEYRSLFSHHSNGYIYLNHAAISPLPVKTAKAINQFISGRQSTKVEDFERWMESVEECRKKIAALIHADKAGQISYMSNTSEGISAVVEGYNWKLGDEVILNTMEFPSNVQPFRAVEERGVNITYLQPQKGMVTPFMIKEAISPKTKMVSISAVQYLNGFRADLEGIGAICKEKNIWFVVDGIQALGATDINVQAAHIDALATGGHKWLMSPMGTGFLYLSAGLANTLRPAKTGWLSVQEPWELSNFNQKWAPLNNHLETGTLNIAGITGMNESLGMFLEIGMDTIAQQITNLSNCALSLLRKKNDVTIVTPDPEENRAGIITFTSSGSHDPDTIVEKLKKSNITISAREGMIRLAPHFYNTEDEVKRAIVKIFDA